MKSGGFIGQDSVIFFGVLFTFIFFITIKGQLSQYMALFSGAGASSPGAGETPSYPTATSPTGMSGSAVAPANYASYGAVPLSEFTAGGTPIQPEENTTTANTPDVYSPYGVAQLATGFPGGLSIDGAPTTPPAPSTNYLMPWNWSW